MTEEYGYPDERISKSPYTTTQKIQRIVWWFACLLLFKPTLRPMYKWRRWILILFGAKIGVNSYVQRSARIEFPWNLEMGQYSAIGEQAWIYSLGKVRIGDFATVSHRAFICTGTHDFTRPELKLITKPVVIESGAWIGADAFVAPGVTIKKNAVIGARAVVTKDMPEAMICAGNPCKPIKPRLPDQKPTPEDKD